MKYVYAIDVYEDDRRPNAQDSRRVHLVTNGCLHREYLAIDVKHALVQELRVYLDECVPVEGETLNVSISYTTDLFEEAKHSFCCVVSFVHDTRATLFDLTSHIVQRVYFRIEELPVGNVGL